MLAFYEAGIEISQRVPNFGALNLTTLTAKTYTTQHDGEFLGFSLYYYPSLVGTFNILLRRVSDCVQQASHDGR